MKTIYVSGAGAISPAGWDRASLVDAVQRGSAISEATLPRPGWETPLRVRAVPPPSPRPAFLAHPRLRRASPVSQHAAGAAMEATKNLPVQRRLGLILCFQAGCVQYSDRFYAEALNDPATASPLLFPETVLSAPASHVATLLGNVQVIHTLVGDPGTFLQGVGVGAEWILSGAVDSAVIIGVEEASWLVGNALSFMDDNAVLSSGAGAICLTADPAASMGVALDRITDPQTFSEARTRVECARRMRAELGSLNEDQLLCDGMQHLYRTDCAERVAWSDWSGARLSPKVVLGEALTAAAAWQCVIACDAVAKGSASAALVSVVGNTQQAIGARFRKQL